MAILHDPRRRRFVLERDGLQGVLDYRPREGRILHVTRTWLPPGLRGRGHGARLVRAALEHARAEGWRVTTSCWFVEEYLERTPRYQDLVPDPEAA